MGGGGGGLNQGGSLGLSVEGIRGALGCYELLFAAPVGTSCEKGAAR